jgi:FkbM family methyltransferase
MGTSLRSTLKNGIRKLLASQGYAIVRKDASPHSMDDAFRAIVRRQHAFNTIIDVGASNGSWTLSLIKYFPKCEYLLIEAQPTHKHALEQLSKEHKNIDFALAAAGEAAGHIYFDVSVPLGGLASYTPNSSNNIQVPVTTIDDEIQSRNLSGPYLIKFDTHGFEIPILKGASKALALTDVIIME